MSKFIKVDKKNYYEWLSTCVSHFKILGQNLIIVLGIFITVMMLAMF